MSHRVIRKPEVPDYNSQQLLQTVCICAHAVKTLSLEIADLEKDAWQEVLGLLRSLIEGELNELVLETSLWRPQKRVSMLLDVAKLVRACGVNFKTLRYYGPQAQCTLLGEPEEFEMLRNELRPDVHEWISEMLAPKVEFKADYRTWEEGP